MSKTLLERQIDKYLGVKANDPDVKKFISAVEESYMHFSRDRELLEKSLKISSAEMLALNCKLSEATKDQNIAFQKLIETFDLINYNVSEQNHKSEEIQNISKAINHECEDRNLIVKQLLENLKILQKTNRDLDQFAYIVSHDLKAPLRAIASLAEWIEEEIPTTSKSRVKKNIQLLKERVQKMEKLINGILAYSKAGTNNNEKVIINSKELLLEIIEILNPPKHISINTKGDWPTIETESTKLHQVISNLVSNAIKYNDKKKGIINIECIQLEDCCQISIEDNGPGIDEEYHQKIFSLFQTLSANNSTESSGIGLSIAQKITQEQGGKIWVDSKTGSGTRFTFTWPAKIVNIVTSKP